jgi:hypothetical protein
MQHSLSFAIGFADTIADAIDNAFRAMTEQVAGKRRVMALSHSVTLSGSLFYCSILYMWLPL